MDSSLVVLIITAVLGVIVLSLIMAGFILDQNRFQVTTPPGTTGPTGLVCQGPGIPQKTDSVPSYTRTRPKSTATRPLGSLIPPFASVTHPVEKSYRIRSLTPHELVSPNHWLGQLMAGTSNIIMSLPYLCEVDDLGFKFSWPNSGSLTQRCPFNRSPTGGCELGAANLFYNIGWGPSIKITSRDDQALGCDLLDVDALIGTLVWQYRNSQTQSTGQLQMPLAKGCPFITVMVGRLAVALTLDFTYSLNPFNSTRTAYTIQIDAATGYLLLTDVPLTLLNEPALGYIATNLFTGTIRLAYYASTAELQNLYAYHSEVPVESTIGATLVPTGHSHLQFEWATRAIDSHDAGVLMYAMPHHHFINTNIQRIGELINHPTMGPLQLVVGPYWILSNPVSSPGFEYPIPKTGVDALILVWQTEIQNVFPNPPADTVSWCEWLGSVAILLLIGAGLNQSIQSGLDILKSNLSAIGNLGPTNTLVYDRTWNGIIGSLGLNNCQGDGDAGNAFYENHIGQFGYVVYAYAVAGHFDLEFIGANAEMALLFARTILNPYERDSSFPLWRNKDWYFGTSISSGLTPNQSRGKNIGNLGSVLLGYYGGYLLSEVLPEQRELRDWSLGMLGAEIASLQTYFQFGAAQTVTVDSAFVEGTINQRGDTYYDYNVSDGNLSFPARHASMIIPLLKPLTQSSFTAINLEWAQYLQPFIASALSARPSPEAYGYANALLSVGSSDRGPLIRNIVANSGIYLPYGSTWSSLLYWILTV